MRRGFLHSARSYWDQIDKVLFATIVAVSLFGLVNVYGIGGLNSPFFQKHLLVLAIGFSTMFGFSLFDYRYFKNHPLPALSVYLLSIFLLLLTFTSTSVRGTNSWIVVGNLTFEPSELAKLMLIIIMAKYFSQRHVHIYQFKHLFVSGIYFFIPAALVISQPDLGSAIILSIIWLGMLLAAGINRRQIFLLSIVIIIVSFVAWVFLLQPYQRDRIVSFIDPYVDPQGSGYSIIQSRVAIGSGSWFGSGLGQGSQAKLGFLPEPYHDFAFSAAVEQFGFIGITLFLAAVILILYRVLEIGSRANNNFGKLFSIGLSIVIFSHVFISAAVNIGLMPVTGLPLTFLSYGGSHMISVMVGLGIIQAVKRYG